MIDIPSNIKINGVEIKIELVNELRDTAGTALCGFVDYNKNVIKLDNKIQDDQGVIITLWHEIFHYIANSSYIELGTKEEQVVEMFARAIYQITKENPKLTCDEILHPKNSPIKD